MHLTKNLKGNYVMARIMRQKKKYHKNFHLKEYETWDAALEAGRDWIDHLMKDLPPTQMNERDRMTKANRSGIVGVYLARRSFKKSKGNKQYTYFSWAAKWVGCKHRGGVHWMVTNERSEDDAFVLAALTRQMMTEDRDVVQKKFNRIKNRKSYKELLAQKKQNIPKRYQKPVVC